MKNECIAVMDIRFAKAIAHIVRQLKDLEMFLINIAVFYDKFTLCVCNMKDSKRHQMPSTGGTPFLRLLPFSDYGPVNYVSMPSTGGTPFLRDCLEGKIRKKFPVSMSSTGGTPFLRFLPEGLCCLHGVSMPSTGGTPFLRLRRDFAIWSSSRGCVNALNGRDTISTLI